MYKRRGNTQNNTKTHTTRNIKHSKQKHIQEIYNIQNKNTYNKKYTTFKTKHIQQEI
jgi:hypothetical protein